MVSFGESCHRFWGVASIAIDNLFTLPLLGLRQCVSWNPVLQGCFGHGLWRQFLHAHTRLDLAGLPFVFF